MFGKRACEPEAALAAIARSTEDYVARELRAERGRIEQGGAAESRRGLDDQSTVCAVPLVPVVWARLA